MAENASNIWALIRQRMNSGHEDDALFARYRSGKGTAACDGRYLFQLDLAQALIDSGVADAKAKSADGFSHFQPRPGRRRSTTPAKTKKRLSVPTEADEHVLVRPKKTSNAYCQVSVWLQVQFSPFNTNHGHGQGCYRLHRKQLGRAVRQGVIKRACKYPNLICVACDVALCTHCDSTVWDHARCDIKSAWMDLIPARPADINSTAV